jgi:hypothetical protein
MYCLIDQVNAKYNRSYFPEKEADEQSVKNAIRLMIDNKHVEISTILDRLKPLTQEPMDRVRYYVQRICTNRRKSFARSGKKSRDNPFHRQYPRICLRGPHVRRRHRRCDQNLSPTRRRG